VAALARKLAKPVHLVAGSAVPADLPLLEEQFDSIRLLRPPHLSHAEAMANASRLLEEACAELAKEWLKGGESHERRRL
jgi:glycerate kinase